jgi:MFS family permease
VFTEIAARRGVLAHRNLRLLLAARTASMLGTAAAGVAIPFAVLETGGAVSEVGVVLAAFWVPQLALLLVGGVFADRMPRQRVMVLADLAAAAAQGTAAVLLLTDTLTIPALVALQVVGGAASAFFYPASTALVPQTVPPGELRPANALLRGAVHGASVAGAGLGGVLAAVSVGGALAVDAATFAVSAGCCALIAVGAAGEAERGRTLLAELRAGWTEFARRRWVWVVVLQFSAVNACSLGALLVLGPVQADRFLGGASAWGLVMACFSAGLLIGAAISFRLRPSRPLVLAELSVLFSAIPAALLIGPAPLPVLAAGVLAAGVSVEVFEVQWTVALQQHIPPHALARVSSFDALGSFAAIPLGLAAAGPLADLLGMRSALIAAGSIIALSAVAALAVRDVRDLPATDDPRP